jgi:diacylglycerol kinase family enzyme
VYDGKFLIAVFGNAPLYGRYVWFMPDARMDDGMLNMSGLRPMSPIPAWSLLMKCMTEGFHSDKIIYDQSERFSIELMEDSFLQIDGEVYRYDEGEKLELSVEHNALRVRLPKGENPSVFAGG